MSKMQKGILVILASIVSCIFLVFFIFTGNFLLQRPHKDFSANNTSVTSQPTIPNQPSTTPQSFTLPTLSPTSTSTHVVNDTPSPNVSTPLSTITIMSSSTRTPIPNAFSTPIADTEVLTNTIDKQISSIAKEACEVNYQQGSTIAKICADTSYPQFFRSVDGCLTVYFPPEVVTEDTIVTYKPQFWPYYDLRPLAVYELMATTVDGNPITNFEKEIVIQFYYSYENLPEWLEVSIAGFIWNENTATWDYTSTTVDPDENLAQFRTEKVGFHSVSVTGLGSLKIEGSGPGKCNSPFAQPTPTLIIDIPNLLNRPLAEVEEIFGPGEIQDFDLYEEELRFYYINEFPISLFFDEDGIARRAEIALVYTTKDYSKDDLPTLLARFNLHPDVPVGQEQTIIVFDEGGFDVTIWLERGSITQVFIKSEQYTPTRSPTPAREARPASVYPAPDFELQTPDGEMIRLSDFKGKVVLLSFWATWCWICLDQFPDFQQVFVDNSDRFIIIGVNDTRRDEVELVNSFIEEAGVTFPIVLDETGQTINKDFGILAFPTNIFIDTNGNINEVNIGFVDAAYIEAKLSELE